MVDIMDVGGQTVGGMNRWFSRAADRAGEYLLDDGRSVRAVSPPFFLATKLVALQNLQRSSAITEAKDAEDIVALAVEVPNLVEMVRAEGIDAEIAQDWALVFKNHKVTTADLPEIVDCHLGQRDAEHRQRVVDALQTLSTQSS
jgi:hypothetical protein